MFNTNWLRSISQIDVTISDTITSRDTIAVKELSKHFLLTEDCSVKGNKKRFNTRLRLSFPRFHYHTYTHTISPSFIIILDAI